MTIAIPPPPLCSNCFYQEQALSFKEEEIQKIMVEENEEDEEAW